MKGKARRAVINSRLSPRRFELLQPASWVQLQKAARLALVGSEARKLLIACICPSLSGERAKPLISPGPLRLLSQNLNFAAHRRIGCGRTQGTQIPLNLKRTDEKDEERRTDEKNEGTKEGTKRERRTDEKRRPEEKEEEEEE